MPRANRWVRPRPLAAFMLLVVAGMSQATVQVRGEQAEEQACASERWKPSEDDLTRARTGKRKNLCKADLTGADLAQADLRGANLARADLTGANLARADLTGATLAGAELTDADLSLGSLSEADLSGADLSRATLSGANLSAARLPNANLTDASYVPASAPPNPYVAGIKGLSTTTFPEGQEIGLVQLRDLLRKEGLRDLEREATFAIEHTRTQHLLGHWLTGCYRVMPLSFFTPCQSWQELPLVLWTGEITWGQIFKNVRDVAEGVFRYIVFELPTGYGLNPGRALEFIALFWIGLIPLYFWPIRFKRRRPATSGIFRIWSADRIEPIEIGEKEEIKTGLSVKPERLQGGTWAALAYASYFSLLSAFHIGWHDFNMATWITRIQPQDYGLKATGWVRVVSGLQSLASVYLVAIWALTYFGRPFQ